LCICLDNPGTDLYTHDNLSTRNKMEIIRAFIAIDLPTQILEQIQQLQEFLLPITNSLIRWTKPENIHLTLKFLGEFEKQKLNEVQNVIREIATTEVSFTLFIKGYGVFPNLEQPRIVWVGIDECVPLKTLVRRLEENLRPLGFKPENRPYKPHLTIGRVKQDYSLQKNLKLTGILCTAKTITGSFSVEEIALYRSDLKPGGPVYSRLMVGGFSLSK